MTFKDSYWICDNCGKQYDGLLYGGQLHHYDHRHRLSHENWGEPIPDFDFCPECYPKIHRKLNDILGKDNKLVMKKGWFH